MYAIIEDSGTQIKVSPGDVLEIDLREDADEGAQITFERVLAIGDGEGGVATLGAPYIEGATVTAEVLGELRDRKVNVIKYTRRKGYRRKAGHRQRYLRVKIGEVKS